MGPCPNVEMGQVRSRDVEVPCVLYGAGYIPGYSGSKIKMCLNIDD